MKDRLNKNGGGAIPVTVLADVDDTAPLLRLRVLGTDGRPSDRRLVASLLSRPIAATRVCEKHGTPRCAECFPKPAPFLDRAELHERVQRIEREFFRLNEPITVRRPLDEIRNRWLAEKNREDAVEAKKNGQVFISDPKKSGLKFEALDLRSACRLSTRDLARLIKDKKFCKPFVVGECLEPERVRNSYRVELEKQKAHTVVRKIKTPDGTTQDFPVTIAPMTKAQRRKSGLQVAVRSVVPAKIRARETMALTSEEAAFYEDYAARNLEVTEMVERHGAWADDQIQGLEWRILRHAAKVGLIVLPKCRLDGEFEQISDADRAENDKVLRREYSGREDQK